MWQLSSHKSENYAYFLKRSDPSLSFKKQWPELLSIDAIGEKYNNVINFVMLRAISTLNVELFSILVGLHFGREVCLRQFVN